MNIDDLKYLKQTLEFIRDNTELIDVQRMFETYSNNMMNSENIINKELSERQSAIEVSEKHESKALNIADVSNWVSVKDALPNDDSQVFVKYENGKYGINEWWENDNYWKYNFTNMIVIEWCKPPCC